MAQISVETTDETKDALKDRADYPDRLLSDVVREALQVYLELDNPEELIDESDSE